MYYTSLILAEAFGKSGTSRVIGLAAKKRNIRTPTYVIWQNAVLSEFALFDYVADLSGVAVNSGALSIGGGQTGQPAGTPATVKMKY